MSDSRLQKKLPSIYYLSASTLPARTANSVHVMKMCQAFARLGIDLTLFAQGLGGGEKEIFSQYNVAENFGLALSPKPLFKPLSAFFRLFAYYRSICRHKDPDYYYGRDPMALFLFAHLRGVAFIFEAHHLPTSKLQAFIVKRLACSPSLKGLVTVSEALKRDMLDTFPVLENISSLAVHDGADVPASKCHPILFPEDPAPTARIGYVGSLYQGRGVELILQLAKKLPSVHFHLVGGSEEEVAHWKSLVDGDNLFFHGYVLHRDVDRWLASFDILLAPYAHQVRIGTGFDTSKWMSPLKIFEYMGAGKAIIASDIPVLREVLRDGENCMLAPYNDVNAWKNVVCHLIENETLRNNLGVTALQDLREKYSWEARAKTIARIFDLTKITI